ncbi:tautomerase family protein, partial [Mycobacterium kubicae]|uniref:tautomerase family protein n=1 Tax=Mycobacterium kubicae TaxID=120959 RepID=UPI000A7C48FB
RRPSPINDRYSVSSHLNQRPWAVQLVVLHVVSRRRPKELKERFYKLVAANLAERCGIDPADLIISVTENDDDDWSFGHGRAQFLTGELK